MDWDTLSNTDGVTLVGSQVIGADVSRSISAGKGSTTAMTYAGVVGTRDRQACCLGMCLKPPHLRHDMSITVLSVYQ